MGTGCRDAATERRARRTGVPGPPHPGSAVAPITESVSPPPHGRGGAPMRRTCAADVDPAELVEQASPVIELACPDAAAPLMERMRQFWRPGQRIVARHSDGQVMLEVTLREANHHPQHTAGDGGESDRISQAMTAGVRT